MPLAALLAAAAPAPEPLPSAFRLNQVGLEAGRAATVEVAVDDAAPLRWRLSGSRQTGGAATMTGRDLASGERLQRISLPPLPAGTYRLAAAGLTSRVIRVAAHPYAELDRDALGFFTQQRSGTAITRAMVQRAGLERPAGHLPDRATCFSGPDAAGVVWPGCALTRDVTGGWYDAGDQGKYVVNGGIAAWTLGNAIERGMGRAALRAEARWEVEWLLGMQVPADTRLSLRRQNGRVADADAGGLAFAKIADVRWTPLPTAPWADPERRYLYPPTIAATYNLAAVAAQCARVWRHDDPALAARCRGAATAAWDAAARDPDIAGDVATAGSGGYDDPKTSDERFWAAAELWAATADARYRAAVDSDPQLDRAGELGWNETATAGLMTLAAVPPSPERDRARAALVRLADGLLAERVRSGYDIPFAGTDYVWGSNARLLNRGVVLGVAYDLTHREAYRGAERDTLDYVLGRNALDRSYVTGYGARFPREPHHRFWAPWAGAKWPAPPPGALVSGPTNTRGNQDIATARTTTCAPMACWRDDHRVFTENEVAINWNAALLWVVLHLTATETGP